MASDVAATEELFGDNSFSNLLAKGEDLTNHDNAYQSGLGFGDNEQYSAILCLEEGEPERDSTMPATPSDLDFDANQMEEQVSSLRLRFELGTSSSSIGDQKPGPQETFSNINLDAYVATALMLLPTWAPKPIWDEGIWSVIFGDGILLKQDFCNVEYYKPKPTTCLDSWVEQLAECRRELERSLPESVSDSFADVVRHVPEITWQEGLMYLFIVFCKDLLCLSNSILAQGLSFVRLHFLFLSAQTRVCFGMCVACVCIQWFALVDSSSCHTCPFRVSYAFSVDLGIPGVPGRHGWSNDLGVSTVSLDIQSIFSAHTGIGKMDTSLDLWSLVDEVDNSWGHKFSEFTANALQAEISSTAARAFTSRSSPGISISGI